MNKLRLREPVSGGIFLSYKCTSECKHCMYTCSPRWNADWIAEKDAERILTQLAGRIQGSSRIGVNSGLHFTGGEPFLNLDLLLKLTRIAHELRIPSTFVETNCFWCTDDNTTREKLAQLKEAGLQGMLVSVNPFILEQVPFERTERAARIGWEVFGDNAIVYQGLFYEQFRRLGVRGSVPFEEYLRKAPGSLQYAELLPMGRAPYKLWHLCERYSASRFFGESCVEELTRPWHVHVDNYCNYVTGYCGGISLGDARDLGSLCRGIDMDERPILEALVTNLKRLHDLAIEEFGYEEQVGGYISKCHLCVDLRRHIAQQTDQFKELRPREFYHQLE